MTCGCVEQINVTDVSNVIVKTWFGGAAASAGSALFQCSFCCGRVQTRPSKKKLCPNLQTCTSPKGEIKSTGGSSTEDLFLCLACGLFFCIEHTKSHYEKQKSSGAGSSGSSVGNHAFFFGVPRGENTQGKPPIVGMPRSVFPMVGKHNIEDLLDGKLLDLERERALVPLPSSGAPREWVFILWCACIGKPIEFRASDRSKSNALLGRVKELGFLIASYWYCYQKGIRLDHSVDASVLNRHVRELADGTLETRLGADSQSGHDKTADEEVPTAANSSGRATSFMARKTQADAKSLLRPRIAGIKNPLNTCYLNAVLQCVLKCRFFTHRLLSIDKAALPGPLSRSLYNMTHFMNGNGEMDVQSRDAYPFAQAVLRCISDISPMFSKGDQQDCQELFLCMANGVADEFDAGKSEAQKKETPRISFEGVTCTKVTCRRCKNCIPREETFMALSVPVEDSIEGGLRKLFCPVELKGKDQYACEECFKRLTEAERERHNATVRAENEKKEKSKKKSASDEKRSLNCVYSDAAVSTCICRLGNTLVLHLLRFHFDGRDIQKIIRKVEFPMSLDLSSFVSTDVLQEYERKRALSSLQLRYSHVRYDSLVSLLDSTSNNLQEAEQVLLQANKNKHLNGEGHGVSELRHSKNTTKRNISENNIYTTTTTTNTNTTAAAAAANGNDAYNMHATGSYIPGLNHMDSLSSQEKKREHQPSLMRSLVGIVTHRGSLHGGHYVAYVRDTVGLNTWFRCDDEDVEVVDDEQVLKCQSEVYMLFYE